MATQYLTPRKYAELWAVHYNTVYHWINMGILPGVITQRIFIRNRYYIPVDTIPPRPYPGPKPKRRADAVTHNLCDNIPDDVGWLPGQISMMDDPPPWEEETTATGSQPPMA